MLKKIFMVWFPRNDVRKSRAQLGVFFIAGYLPLFEVKTGIDAKALVVEVPG